MNRWYFWVLAPVAIGSAIVIPRAADPPSLWGRVLVWVLVGTLLLGTLGLANTRRFGWALRSVAAVIVGAGVAYFVAELVAWGNGKPLGAFGRRSENSLWNAGLFLLVFGVPALRYLISGRSESVVDVIAAPEAVDDESAFDGPSQLGDPRNVERDGKAGQHAAAPDGIGARWRVPLARGAIVDARVPQVSGRR